MPRALLIGPAEAARIDELRAFAKSNIFDAKAAGDIFKRDPAAFRDMMRLHSMELPVGFRVTYTHEVQPNAPPPGLCAHLSVSLDDPDRAPSQPEMDMILAAFGMKDCEHSESVWVEDIRPGEKAVNVLQLL